jgi:hypothetical protein
MPQKRTYFIYEGGIDPLRLRIGSLYLDFSNPTIGLESKRFDFREDLDDDTYWKMIQNWTGKPQSTAPCSFGFGVGKESNIGTAILNTLAIDWENQYSVRLSLVGASGRRFEVQKPETFFRKEVFSQSKAKNWIKKQYSISFTTRIKNAMHHKSWKAPDIWVLTGIQLVEGGSIQGGVSSTTKASGSLTIDPGIAQATSTGQNISVNGRHGQNATVHTEYYHADERVWAAQFMQLDVDFKEVTKPKPEGAQGKQPRRNKKKMVVTLKDVEHFALNALRKPSEEDSDCDSEPVDYVAEIVGLKDIGAEPSEKVERKEDDEVSGLSDEEVEEDTLQPQFSDVDFCQEKYVKAAQGIDWEQWKKGSKYCDDLEEWERSEAAR